jgi:uncharacterized protein YegP (UPF0339 family)
VGCLFWTLLAQNGRIFQSTEEWTHRQVGCFATE